MQLINDYMTRHHKECDAVLTRADEAAAAADWAAVERHAGTFLREIERHIEAEETLLFPAFEERTGMADGGPTATMRMEHEQMRLLLVQLEAACGAHDADAYAGAAETLLILMQQHNMKIGRASCRERV